MLVESVYICRASCGRRRSGCVNEAVALLEEVDRTCEELYDKSHGDSQVVKAELKKARAKLARARKAVARRAAATAKSTAAGA